MNVAFHDPLAAYRELQAEIDDAVARVLGSGRYVGGGEVEAFEAAFADHCGAGHCIGVANGFDALHLGLRALGIGAGDEVIVAANSFAATVLAVRAVGACPVFVEPSEATFNLDPERAEAAIGPRTRAILPTHLYGQPADLQPLLALARRHGLALVEDAAQAHGARYRGRPIGAHGDLVAWSFYPTKNLGAMGDGGAVTTNDPTVAAAVRTLGQYGIERDRSAASLGVNSRLDPLQAAILAVKLPHIEAWNLRRRRIADLYCEGIGDTEVALPHAPAWADPAWHLYVVRTVERDVLRRWLADRDIATDVHYPVPPHLQPAFVQPDIGRGAFPVAERLAAEVLSLPIGPHLGDDAVGAVIDAVRAWDRARRDAAPRAGAG
ncbi:MAG: DegT/DnrJ/EryC1/StrS family aminotransferase [Alphaproteobacteria bacterium]|nr:DegT/DnrJ/EryC1/StrS family aminotransferase [Alphaproteobacteria bacterium]